MTQCRLHHGSYHEELDTVEADLIFTSPPYNIGSKAPRQDGQRKRGLYDAKSFGAIRDYPDDLPEAEYQDQQEQFMLWAADHLTQDGVLVYNHKPRRRDGTMIHPAEWFLRPSVRKQMVLIEEVIWDRGSTHNHGSRILWPQTERLYVFRRTDGRPRFKNTAGLSHRADIWRITKTNRNGHACAYPVELALAVIRAWSRPGDLVCDPYLGSGTTAVAAKMLGRSFEGSEILQKYFDQATDAVDSVKISKDATHATV